MFAKIKMKTSTDALKADVGIDSLSNIKLVISIIQIKENPKRTYFSHARLIFSVLEKIPFSLFL